LDAYIAYGQYESDSLLEAIDEGWIDTDFTRGTDIRELMGLREWVQSSDEEGEGDGN
jgi:hypothetical protein